MLLQIVWALLCTLVTLLTHGAYAYRLILMLRRHSTAVHQRARHADVLSEYVFIEAVLMLLLLHTLEAGIWGLFYFLHPGGLPDFETAMYFSLASYTTIGYGDVLLSPALRLVGAMEGVVGTLMFGLSVGLMAAVVHQSAVYQKITSSEPD